MPYRRGQGLSSKAGWQIGDQIAVAENQGGLRRASQTMARLLGGEQLDDQMAALAWLRSQAFTKPQRIAAAGNSFGGVEALLGASRGLYCAAIIASGSAESWADSPELRSLMKIAARTADSPMMFIQAANDFNLEPRRILSAERRKAGKKTEVRTYPAYGASTAEGQFCIPREQFLVFGRLQVCDAQRSLARLPLMVTIAMRSPYHDAPLTRLGGRDVRETYRPMEIALAERIDPAIHSLLKNS